jgi:hypothetical protein
MAGKTLRTVKPAHKSDRVTVAEAEKAWRKVTNESASGGPSPAPVRGSATSHASSISSKGGTGSGKEKPAGKAPPRRKR